MPKKRYKTKNSGVIYYVVSLTVFIVLCFTAISPNLAGSGKNKMFRESLRSYTGGGTRAITGGDLDGDGDIDLITANLRTSEINIFINNGDGG